jgi:hypothetical protein
MVQCTFPSLTDEEFRENTGDDAAGGTVADAPPLLVVGLSFAPKHKSGIVVRPSCGKLHSKDRCILISTLPLSSNFSVSSP